MRIREVGNRPKPHRVEIGIPGQAPPDELEADAFRDQVVGVEVDPLEDQVVADEPGEHRDVEQDAR